MPENKESLRGYGIRLVAIATYVDTERRAVLDQLIAKDGIMNWSRNPALTVVYANLQPDETGDMATVDQIMTLLRWARENRFPLRVDTSLGACTSFGNGQYRHELSLDEMENLVRLHDLDLRYLCDEIPEERRHLSPVPFTPAGQHIAMALAWAREMEKRMTPEYQLAGEQQSAA